jgi:hypothetical protein
MLHIQKNKAELKRGAAPLTISSPSSLEKMVGGWGQRYQISHDLLLARLKSLIITERSDVHVPLEFSQKCFGGDYPAVPG